MTFHSILFEKADDAPPEAREAPVFFPDLNLDQVIDVITAGREAYNLKPFFYSSLKTAGAVAYRHEVFRDLEKSDLFERMKVFATQMRSMRDYLAQADKLHYKYQKERWFVDAADTYCDAVSSFARDLAASDVSARGLLAFRDYLADYAASDRFRSLVEETRTIKADLRAITYCVLINDNSVTVGRYELQADYSREVRDTFAKFRQEAAKSYAVSFADAREMNHVEAKILDLVAQLHPDEFLALDRYVDVNHDYADETIRVFDREVQFYLAYLEYMGIFRQAGLNMCYPSVSADSKHVCNREGFDIALAYRLVTANEPVVCNDFQMVGEERIVVVSGPNQGGKTTFARSFGQLHYLACIGCPVPGKDARLFLYDRLFTHFEREEHISSLRGKLEDDLFRMHGILSRATPKSIVIMNESFTSTTSRDASVLAQKIMKQIIELDALCVCVTFIDELATMSKKSVSMVSTVAADNAAARTFRIVRRPADGLAYAISIAEKYGLTYERLKERMTS